MFRENEQRRAGVDSIWLMGDNQMEIQLIWKRSINWRGSFLCQMAALLICLIDSMNSRRKTAESNPIPVYWREVRKMPGTPDSTAVRVDESSILEP